MHKTTIFCQFGNLEICPNFANPYLTQFSSISGGNCITDDMSDSLGEAVTATTTMDANLNHCLATGNSLTGCLHFVNKIPVDWYSKKQATVRQLHMVQSLLLPKQQQKKYTPMPLGLRIMQLGLGLNNLTIPFYLIKILIGHTLYMVMSMKSFLMTCQIHLARQ